MEGSRGEANLVPGYLLYSSSSLPSLEITEGGVLLQEGRMRGFWEGEPKSLIWRQGQFLMWGPVRGGDFGEEDEEGDFADDIIFKRQDSKRKIKYDNMIIKFISMSCLDS